MSLWTIPQITASLNEETDKVIICSTTIPHLSDLPVHVPLLHVGEPPCGDRQTRGHVKANQTVVRDPKNLILLTAFESETKGITSSIITKNDIFLLKFEVVLVLTCITSEQL